MGPLQNVIDLAHDIKNIRVCVVSTLSVSGERVLGNKEMFDEKDFDVGQRFDYIYDKTKFEAEKIVRHAIDNGLDVFVVRLGSLVGGPMQRNPVNNSFYQYLRAIISTKKDWNIDTSFDVSPVDISAKGIVCLCKLKNLPIRTFHLFNNRVVKSSEMVGMINELGWTIGSGVSNLLKNDKECFSASLVNYLPTRKNNSVFIYGDSDTRKIMDNVVRWPKIDKKILNDILKKLKLNNLI